MFFGLIVAVDDLLLVMYSRAFGHLERDAQLAGQVAVCPFFMALRRSSPRRNSVTMNGGRLLRRSRTRS